MYSFVNNFILPHLRVLNPYNDNFWKILRAADPAVIEELKKSVVALESISFEDFKGTLHNSYAGLLPSADDGADNPILSKFAFPAAYIDDLVALSKLGEEDFAYKEGKNITKHDFDKRQM